MRRQIIEEATTILNSEFWKLILKAVDTEKRLITDRAMTTTIRFQKDAQKISHLQGQIEGLNKLEKIPEKVLEMLKKAG